MTTTRKSPAPAGLNAAGKRLWDDITRQVADDGLELDASEKRVLADACRTADDAARLSSALETAPVEVVGSTGQPMPNKLFDEVRKSRSLIASLLKQLDLDPSEHRGTGSGSRTTSTSARAAAQVRWSKPTGAA